MLLVKASAKPSKINGIGLFANQEITKGTQVWKFNERFDLVFNEEEKQKMTKITFDFFDHFAYFSKKLGKYILCVDDTRFMNHSIKGNTTYLIGSIDNIETFIANADIKPGEEITINYRDLDAFEEKSQEEYLNK